MKKIIVLGSRGMLGYAVESLFRARGYEVVTLSREEFNIAKEPHQKLATYLKGAATVINCAGVIKPRIAQLSIEETLRVNSIFPRNLARMCSEHSVKCFHITTDCVFSGDKGRYSEKDLFDATDVYGMSKNAGETTDCMTIRTSIIGEEKGTGRSLLEWARSQKGNQVNGFTNHRWNGLTTVHLAEVIEQLVKNDAYEKGIFHFFSPETVDKQQLVSLISEVYEFNLKVIPKDADEACDRSLSSIYPFAKNYCTKPLRTQLIEMRQFFSECA